MITLLLIKIKGKEYVIFLYSSIIEIFLVGVIFGWLTAIISYLIIFLLFKIYESIKIKRNCRFDTFFGVPGAGKSTVATSIALDYLKRNRRVFANFEVSGTTFITKEQITYSNNDLNNCLLIIDEVGIDYNNRGFKTNFTTEALKLFKKHRHKNIDIVIFSQDYEDMDKKLRDLSTRFYLIKKSVIPFFIKTRLITKYIGIDKESKQIIDEYSFVPFGSKYIYMPRTWKAFNTYD